MINHHELSIPKAPLVMSQSRKILYFLILLLFLLSMNIWIGWEGRGYKLQLIIGVMALLAIWKGHIKFSYAKINILTFSLVVIGHFFYGYQLSVFAVFFFLPYFIIICLNDKDKVYLLEYITKWYGYLMIPSLIVYALVSTVGLPHLGYQQASDTSWALDSGYGVCKNYIFYMQSTFGDYVERFNGPFLEPGHLGMISALLIFVNQFDFSRKGMWFILTGLIFSLSLAGYILLVLGFIIYMFYRGKIGGKYLLLILLLFLVIYSFGMYYNGGDNIVYEKILSRLEYDKDKGITGNNRVFGLIEVYYAALWNDTDTMLWGYPKETMQWLFESGSRGAGYMLSICRYGLIGTIVSVLFYFVYVLMSKDKKFAFCCLLFIVLIYLQRSYPFWFSWIICFIYGITSNYYTSKMRYNK